MCEEKEMEKGEGREGEAKIKCLLLRKNELDKHELKTVQILFQIYFY